MGPVERAPARSRKASSLAGAVVVALAMLAAPMVPPAARAHLGMARLVDQWHEHLPRPRPPFPHVVLDDRIAALKPMLIAQAVEDPLCRVTLLARAVPVFLQDQVDDGDVRRQPGRRGGWRRRYP